MIETTGTVGGGVPRSIVPLSLAARRMRESRTCYDHLAGRIAVALADSLIAREAVVLGADAARVTDDGADFLAAFGIDLAAARARKRTFCRVCLDWTERRPHLGGALGAALLCRCLALGWFERDAGSRALRVTSSGVSGLGAVFGIDAAPPRGTSHASAGTRLMGLQ